MHILYSKILPAAIECFPIQILDSILRIPLVINLHKAVWSLDIDMLQVSISFKQLLNVTLTTIMAKISKE